MKIEVEVGKRLAARGWMLAVAESCTGGLIGHRLTSVAGSSGYFAGGIIAYSNEVKVRQLGVRCKVLQEQGAVSEAVASEMAIGARRRFDVELAVSVTGIAGPGGGSRKKPVGLVYMAVAGAGGCRVRRFKFTGNRLAVKNASGQAALEMVRDFLIDEEER